MTASVVHNEVWQGPTTAGWKAERMFVAEKTRSARAIAKMNLTAVFSWEEAFEQNLMM